MPVHNSYFITLYFTLRTFKAAVQIFSRKFKGPFKTLGPRRLTESKFDTEGPKMLNALLQELVANPNWRAGFMHSWEKSYIRFLNTDSFNVKFVGYNNEWSQSYRVQRIVT